MRQPHFLLRALPTLKMNIKRRQVDDGYSNFEPFCPSVGTTPGIHPWHTDEEVLGLILAHSFCLGKLTASPNMLLIGIMA